MDKIELIEQAIEDALAGKSKLTPDILDWPGYTNPPAKRLFNNLGAISTSYLEIGIHKASLLISTLFGNDCKGVGVDNYSQFEEDGLAKQMAYSGCEAFLKPGQVRIIEKDCWEITDKDLDLSSVDMYLFDGNHSYESQRDAIKYFVPKIKKGAIVLVDDASWDDVRRGTYDGIKEAGLEIEYEKFLWNGKKEDDLWNGFFIFVFK